VRRQVPVVSTLIVLAAVATMIGLGVWQLHRKEWKEGLIARYQAAQQASAEVPWPGGPGEYEAALYHRSRVNCAAVTGLGAIAGRSAAGEAGWAHIAHCSLAGGGTADVALGWSNDPAPPAWRGGAVSGWVTGSGERVRLVAAPPQAGLAPLARPDPRDLPNNHLSYAVQWFLFAATALVIYALALRKKWRAEGADRPICTFPRAC
jgi:surfeit locus 1 family protein